MPYHYPKPEQVGISIPPHLMPERFRHGFEHGLRGGQLHRVEYLRLSFREGFRAAKLLLREIRRERGVIPFPLQGRIRLRVR